MMIEYPEEALLQDEQTVQNIISMADFQSCLKFNRMVTFFMLAFLGGVVALVFQNGTQRCSQHIKIDF